MQKGNAGNSNNNYSYKWAPQGKQIFQNLEV